MVPSDVVCLTPSLPEVDGLGGKGTALARLVRGGVRVPPTAVVRTSAYRRAVRTPGLRALVAALERSSVPPDPAMVTEEFLAAPPDHALQDEVLAAIEHLGGGPLAVRSSASAEDLEGHSFAGQYQSFLDVPPTLDSVLDAIRRTWASLWAPPAWAYRRAWAIPDDDVEMAVVLMAMVPAEVAGVVFTVDPGGTPDALRVEAVDGLAEALVSGQRTPRVWVVPRDQTAPLAADCPTWMDELRHVALDIELSCSVAQDLEWAWDGQLWVVQARPITTAPERGDDVDTPMDDHELTTAGVTEMLPGVLPPLVWDVASFLVEEALRGVVGEMDALPDDVAGPYGFVRRVRGRAALDLDLLKDVAAAIPGSSEAEIERQYFGDAAPHHLDDAGSSHRGLRRIAQDLRSARARRRAETEAEVVRAATTTVLDVRRALDELDDGAVLGYRLRLLDLASRAMAAELGVAANAVASYRRLELLLVPHLGEDEAARRTQQVTRGAGRPPVPRHTASRSVFAGTTWEEAGQDPGRAHASTSAEADERRARLAELEGELAALPSWQRTRLPLLDLVDTRMHLLRRLTRDAVTGLRRREAVKADVLALGGEVRRVHLEIGRRLHRRGLLDDAGDVDLLRSAELARALDGTVPPAIVERRRRWQLRHLDAGVLPARFRGRPEPPAPPEPVGDVLTGRAASPGRHTGRPVVALDVDSAAARLRPGDVLVAEATDSAWTPLFLRAGAIVVERGGPLSHAAVVAREFAIPAVLDVSGATQLLRDADLVAVDGDRGTVAIDPEPTRVLRREEVVSP